MSEPTRPTFMAITSTPAKIGEARVIEHREHELIRRALQQLPD